MSERAPVEFGRDACVNRRSLRASKGLLPLPVIQLVRALACAIGLLQGVHHRCSDGELRAILQSGLKGGDGAAHIGDALS